MHRNRKTAAILIGSAALVLALIFAVGHSRASTSKGTSDKSTATSENSLLNAANDPTGLVTSGRQSSGSSDSSGLSNSGQSGNGSGTSDTGGSTTTTVPGGGGHKPPYRRPVDQAGTAGIDVPRNPSPTTTVPPNQGGCGIHQQGMSCP